MAKTIKCGGCGHTLPSIKINVDRAGVDVINICPLCTGRVVKRVFDNLPRYDQFDLFHDKEVVADCDRCSEYLDRAHKAERERDKWERSFRLRHGNRVRKEDLTSRGRLAKGSRPTSKLKYAILALFAAMVASGVFYSDTLLLLLGQ